MEGAQIVEEQIFKPLLEKEVTVRLRGKTETFIFRFDYPQVKTDISNRVKENGTEPNLSFDNALKKLEVSFDSDDTEDRNASIDQKLVAAITKAVAKPFHSLVKPTEDFPGGLIRVGIGGGYLNPDGSIYSLGMAIDIGHLSHMAQTFLGPNATAEEYSFMMENMIRITYDHEAEHVAQMADPSVKSNVEDPGLIKKVLTPQNAGRAGVVITVVGALIPDPNQKMLAVGLGLSLAAAGYSMDYGVGTGTLSEAEAVEKQVNRNPLSFSKVCTVIHKQE